MNIERLVFAIAGMFILISVALSQLHHVYWLGLTVFVGANLFQTAFTGFCPLAKILGALGVKSGHAMNQI
jgi:putative methionine-R-sulfoxide reductase with GAF domain